jgi:hypothetical protein
LSLRLTIRTDHPWPCHASARVKLRGPRSGWDKPRNSPPTVIGVKGKTMVDMVIMVVIMMVIMVIMVIIVNLPIYIYPLVN